jgi:putative transposase
VRPYRGNPAASAGSDPLQIHVWRWKLPRAPRICFPGAIFHLTTRRVEKRALFRDHGDRLRFLDLLDVATTHYRWRVHAYCLMTNHYHLVVDTPRANVSCAMQYLNGQYAAWFNAKYRREGHLVERRFRSVLVKTQEHALVECRYVVLNPVRAGICRHPSEWPWSSYGPTAGLAPVPSFLTLEWTLGLFDGSRDRYRLFVEDAVELLADAA